MEDDRKKTSPEFGRAKIKGGLCQQRNEPMVKGDRKKEHESPRILQWLINLKKGKKIEQWQTCLQIDSNFMNHKARICKI